MEDLNQEDHRNRFSDVSDELDISTTETQISFTSDQTIQNVVTLGGEVIC